MRARINELAIGLIGAPVDDIVLAPPHTVPKTSSGKIRRVAAREYYERGPSAVKPHAVWVQFLRLMLAGVWPRRLAQTWCEMHACAEPLTALSAMRLRAIAHELQHWRIVPSGTLGYNKAEVTLGGVDTDGVSSSTMMSKHVPGLFFVGEVLDVTGWLGGYNFQWAWSTGWVAGMGAAFIDRRIRAE